MICRRAADDFRAIRARMEELRRECLVAIGRERIKPDRQPYSIMSRPEIGGKRDLQAIFRRLLSR
jgi:hypothetical protein